VKHGSFGTHVPVGRNDDGDEDNCGNGLPVDDEDQGAHAAGERRLGPQRQRRVDALRHHHGRHRLVLLHGGCGCVRRRALPVGFAVSGSIWLLAHGASSRATLASYI
jgi:hypothetical protein